MKKSPKKTVTTNKRKLAARPYTGAGAGHSYVKPKREPLNELHPDLWYRLSDAFRFIGCAASQFDNKLKAGEIEPPIKLSANGRIRGYFGRDLIRMQQAIVAANKQVA